MAATRMGSMRRIGFMLVWTVVGAGLTVAPASWAAQPDPGVRVGVNGGGGVRPEPSPQGQDGRGEHPYGEARIGRGPNHTDEKPQYDFDLVVRTHDGAEPFEADVNIHIRLFVNPQRLGTPYRERRATACKDWEFPMSQEFVEAHERHHIQQIQTIVRDRLARIRNGGSTKYGKVHYRLGGQEIPGNSPKFQELLRDEVNAILDDFERETGATYRSTRSGAPEQEAREAACRDFMDRVGNNLEALLARAQAALDDVRAHLAESKRSMEQAARKARDAKKAAEDALAAAERCDLEALRKALRDYAKARGEATYLVEYARGQLAQAQTELETEAKTALTALEGAMVAAGVTAFPGPKEPSGGRPRQPERLKKDLEAFEKELKDWADNDKGLEKRAKKVEETLAQADAAVAKIPEALKKCREKDAAKWGPSIEEFQKHFGQAPGGRGDSPPGGEKGPEAPKPGALRSMIQSLENANARVEIHVPAPPPDEPPVRRAIIPRPWEEPTKDTKLGPATTGARYAPPTRPEEKKVEYQPQGAPMNPPRAALVPSTMTVRPRLLAPDGPCPMGAGPQPKAALRPQCAWE